MYNITFTFLPVIVFGLFEQKFPENVLLSRAFLYKRISGNSLMSWKLFFLWFLSGQFNTSLIIEYFLFIQISANKFSRRVL